METAVLAQGISDALDLTQKLASSNDRYLFIGSQLILIVGGAFIIRWLVNSLEKKDEAHNKANKELHDEIKDERAAFSAKFDSARDEFMQAIARRDEECRAHTAALRDLTTEIRTLNHSK